MPLDLLNAVPADASWTPNWSNTQFYRLAVVVT
jgi:hypothetical protein